MVKFQLNFSNDKLSSSFSMQDLQLFDEIKWIGSGPPIAEPRCGFRGEKCISK